MEMPRIKVAKLPEGWKENPNPGPMRAASFVVTGGEGNEAEVAVIPMAGMADIEVQLVNMWREQVKLPPITEADTGSQSTEVTIGEAKGKLFDLSSTEPVLGGRYKARILVALLRRGGTAWFFKFAGEQTLVSGQKDAFIDFLEGISFETPVASGLPAGHPPVGGGMAGGMGQGMMAGGGATVPAGAGEHPDWQVPTTWTEVAHSTFLVAKFQTRGEGDLKAEINVSKSPGDGGGLLPNVNRWRGQLSLGALDAAALEKIATPLELPAGKAILVDFTGEGAENNDPVRCIAVMVSLPGETWFYKLMGSATLVGREKDALFKFVRSVKY